MSLPRAALRAVAVVFCLFFLAASVSANYRIVKAVKQGQWSAVYRVRHVDANRRDVPFLKTIKRGPRSEAYARAHVEIGAALQKDPAFRERFGDGVIPAMELTGPSRFLLDAGKGVPHGQVPENLRGIGAADREAAASFAEERYPGFRFTRQSHNFLYDATTGRITSWFDLLSDGSPQPVLGIEGPPAGEDKENWRKHVIEQIGEGNHGIVYLLDQAPARAPDPKMVVLKRYKEVDRGDNQRANEKARLFVATIDQLRQSGVLQERFGRDILPEAAVVGTGKVAMTFMPGLPIGSLRVLHGENSEIVKRAEEQARAAVQLASDVLGTGRVGAADTYNGIGNFLVDPDTGEVTGWPDPGLHL